MFGSLDPQKMAKVQEVSSRINAEIKILYKDNMIGIKFTPVTEDADRFLKSMMPQFAEALATQLTAFFQIKGEIVDVGRPA